MRPFLKKLALLSLWGLVFVLVGFFQATPSWANTEFGTGSFESVDCKDLTSTLSTPENLKSTHILCYIQRILTMFGFVLPGTVAVFMLLYSGYLYISSQGDPAKFKKATDTAIFAIFGLAIIALAAVIVHFTGLLIGADYGV